MHQTSLRKADVDGVLDWNCNHLSLFRARILLTDRGSCAATDKVGCEHNVPFAKIA